MASSDQPQSPANDLIVPFQQVDVPSNLPNRSEFPHQSMHMPLTIQYTSSMVPEMPGANLSISFPSIKAEPASSRQAELDSIDKDHAEFNQQEAYLLLDIARAEATVHHLDQQLVHAKLDENIALGNLYKCQAQESKRRLENVEAELGCIRNSIWMSGATVHRKCCHEGIGDEDGDSAHKITTSSMNMHFTEKDTEDSDCNFDGAQLFCHLSISPSNTAFDPANLCPSFIESESSCSTNTISGLPSMSDDGPSSLLEIDEVSHRDALVMEILSSPLAHHMSLPEDNGIKDISMTCCCESVPDWVAVSMQHCPLWATVAVSLYPTGWLCQFTVSTVPKTGIC
ncbi:hypothetical protein BKA83DRAFT_4129424 [Pisolithus microcarpus]|nr:hypothetical protein BKA83DRAFT_4129424 [Pisolithus microcarpus]